MEFNNCTVLLLGAGYMAREYAKALHFLGFRDVTIVSRNIDHARDCAEAYNYNHYGGGLDTIYKLNRNFDLMISAVTVHDILHSAGIAVETGIKKILLEKPVALNSGTIKDWLDRNNKQDVSIRAAFNRMCYPNVNHLLKLVRDEGGITSCNYSFTEWTKDVESYNFDRNILERWGLYNSMHIISLVHKIIGFPADYKFCQSGNDIPWHKAGSVFIGAGITEKNIAFSYNSNWASAGRWWIDFMTRENCYRLMPIEKLQVSKRNTVNWEFVEFKNNFPQLKQGVAEEIICMFEDSCGSTGLPDLKETIQYLELSEKIFGYTS